MIVYKRLRSKSAVLQAFLKIKLKNVKLFRDEVRIYPREARLDNTYSSVEVVEAQVLLINKLEDR